jgi:hypothetical protein
MGDDNPLDNPSQSECHSAGSPIHISPEESQPRSQGKEGQRISLDDHRVDDGEQMFV